MLRQEMNIGYFNYIHRPGEKLGVFDNGSDFEECAKRTHSNCTHGGLCPGIKWNEETKEYEVQIDMEDLHRRLEAFDSRWTGKRHSIMGCGEHNNTAFPYFYQYIDRIPDALMQGIDGQFLVSKDPNVMDGRPVPMPAIDDPGILKRNAKAIAVQASLLPGKHYVAAYLVGGEMLWPEYFELGNGDYRPVSWKHFTNWCKLQGEAVPTKEQTLVEGTKERSLWLRYREQAMADRGGYYYRTILEKDNTHLAFYPTHGSMMHGTARAKLSQQPDTLAAVTDGIEMGHILIDDDAERRNVLMTSLNTCYGAPVIVPRLGNKTADLGAAGGGRSFTPATLRRLVMEDVGMGISIIFPIHWRCRLHDGEWGIKNTPAEAECRKVFDEIILSAPYMMGMGRMQPQVGILASDETWLQAYDERWTALMQDVLNDRAYVTVITDAVIEPGFAKKMPVILAVEDRVVADKTLERLVAYMNEGGKVIVWGEFAAESQNRDKVLSHPNCLVSQAPVSKKLRVIRECFLASIESGIWNDRYKLYPVDYQALKAEINTFAPDALLHPFVVSGNPGKTNIYPLTDRAALGCVCINNGSEDVEFTVAPDERLLKNAVAIDMVTGQKLQMPVKLPGHGTAMIFFGEQVGDDFDEVLCAAEDAFLNWRQMGMEVGPLRHYFANLKTGDHYIKRYALAKGLLSSMALRTKCEMQGEELLVEVDCVDADGNTVEDANVQLRMVPGSMRQYVLTWDGEKYACRIPRDQMAKVYNPDTCDYDPLSGAARLVIQAEKGELQGGCLVNVKI